MVKGEQVCGEGGAQGSHLGAEGSKAGQGG